MSRLVISSSTPFYAAIAVFEHALTVHRLLQIGGLGLVVIGVLGAVLPLSGGLEAATLILTTGNRSAWAYYVAMATLGAVLGGNLTYTFGQRGGQAMLVRYRGSSHLNALFAQFERFGFGIISVVAMLPPPVPLMPFLLTAGALHYPRRKFLLAVSVGRATRYSMVALVAVLYGEAASSYLHQAQRPVLIGGGIALAALVILPSVFKAVFFSKPKSH